MYVCVCMCVCSCCMCYIEVGPITGDVLLGKQEQSVLTRQHNCYQIIHYTRPVNVPCFFSVLFFYF